MFIALTHLIFLPLLIDKKQGEDMNYWIAKEKEMINEWVEKQLQKIEERDSRIKNLKLTQYNGIFGMLWNTDKGKK